MFLINMYKWRILFQNNFKVVSVNGNSADEIYLKWKSVDLNYSKI
jgi:hypothetical protein